MFKKKPGVDVIMDILRAVQQVSPSSKFIESLLFQYQERGGLSKRQLQGLYDKALRIDSISPGKLATLEAIILKKVTRYKSPQPMQVPTPLAKDTGVEESIEAILQKYPQHKRVLFYQAKFNNKEDLTATEKAELERFKKLLLK
jgi:hypothetical protein